MPGLAPQLCGRLPENRSQSPDREAGSASVRDSMKMPVETPLLDAIRDPRDLRDLPEDKLRQVRR